MSVVTRIAPSPTGFLHFGLARTALYSYLYAKKHGGQFIIRIEDTDTSRNKPEYETDILEQLEWLGLKADKIYKQTEHLERHQWCLNDLIERDLAYVSKEPAKDDPSREVEVVRLRNPGETITFEDGVRGAISFDTSELKDFVIARSVNDPLYHFAVVVDDHDEGVTHVIRGDDHISNTPRQILILKALGFPIPSYTHLPLILMPDKSKMSKRKHETAVKSFREKGILPEALINYIAMLGWTPKSDREILGIDELIAEFDLKDLHVNGAVFDIEKLRWFNREYLHAMSESEFKAGALSALRSALETRNIPWDDTVGEKLMPVLRERISTWGDIAEQVSEGEYDYFFADPNPDPNKIPQKGDDASTAHKHLSWVYEALHNYPSESFNDQSRLKDVMWDYATNEGRGSVLWPLRFALSGVAKSPDPFTIASLIGKDATLRRIERARALLV
jgi:glutamyl-tRNA synthetase